MAKFVGIWSSGHSQLTKIKLTDGRGANTITTAAQFAYDRARNKSYLGNVG
jgi:hypothetical protein